MKVIISGGGTAGHINPGIAIAKKIMEKDKGAQIIFVGTKKGLENKLVPREGFELKTIRVKGFRRKLSFDTFATVKELFIGLSQAKKLLKEFKPDIVIGTGGFVCGPILFYATRLKIPTIIHEQNAFPGVTNRILSRFVDVVAISFEESREYFKSAKNVKLTGNPIRQELLDVDRALVKKDSNFTNKEKKALVFGGSRGAKVINDTVVDMIKIHYKKDFSMIFATGEVLNEEVLEKLKDVDAPNIDIVPYIYNMKDALVSADLVICRSGAITVCELAAVGIPAILIPSPNVTANHQEYNAKVLENADAGVILLEEDLTPENLYNKIKDLLSNNKLLDNMSKNCRKVAVLDASERMYTLVQNFDKAL